MIILIMGVSGCGKSTVGARLAAALGWPFQEGDDLHPAANIAKMASGRPLDDQDRAPWLAAVAAWIDERIAAGGHGVVSCSALRRAYRRQLTEGRPDVRLVYLKADQALLAERLAGRVGHFMPAALLESQLATLEPPGPEERPVAVAADQPLETQVARIAEALNPPVVGVGDGSLGEPRRQP